MSRLLGQAGFVCGFVGLLFVLVALGVNQWQVASGGVTVGLWHACISGSCRELTRNGMTAKEWSSLWAVRILLLVTAALSIVALYIAGNVMQQQGTRKLVQKGVAAFSACAVLTFLAMVIYMSALTLPDGGHHWDVGVAMVILSWTLWYPLASAAMYLVLGSKRYMSEEQLAKGGDIKYCQWMHVVCSPRSWFLPRRHNSVILVSSPSSSGGNGGGTVILVSPKTSDAHNNTDVSIVRVMSIEPQSPIAKDGSQQQYSFVFGDSMSPGSRSTSPVNGVISPSPTASLISSTGGPSNMHVRADSIGRRFTRWRAGIGSSPDRDSPIPVTPTTSHRLSNTFVLSPNDATATPPTTIRGTSMSSLPPVVGPRGLGVGRYGQAPLSGITSILQAQTRVQLFGAPVTVGKVTSTNTIPTLGEVPSTPDLSRV